MHQWTNGLQIGTISFSQTKRLRSLTTPTARLSTPEVAGSMSQVTLLDFIDPAFSKCYDLSLYVLLVMTT